MARSSDRRGGLTMAVKRAGRGIIDLHPQKERIEALIVQCVPVKKVARRFGLSLGVVYRHRNKISYRIMQALLANPRFMKMMREVGVNPDAYDLSLPPGRSTRR